MLEVITRINNKLCPLLNLHPLHPLKTKESNLFWTTAVCVESSKKYVLGYEKKERIEFTITEFETKKEFLKIDLQSQSNPLSLNQILYLRDNL